MQQDADRADGQIAFLRLDARDIQLARIQDPMSFLLCARPLPLVHP
jgi:hypothetical protein